MNRFTLAMDFHCMKVTFIFSPIANFPNMPLVTATLLTNYRAACWIKTQKHSTLSLCVMKRREELRFADEADYAVVSLRIKWLKSTVSQQATSY